MKHIIDYFQRVDPILYSVINNYHFPKSRRGNDYFVDLCEIIIQQQLSEKAGETIFKRFKKLFPRDKLTAEKLLQLSDDEIRNTGPSNMKVKYLKNIAQYFISNTIKLDQLQIMADEAIIHELTKIKGIGRWSVKMFLMFSLGREDVFSYGDLGLRKAIQKLYKLKKQPTQKQAEKISNKWKPYRTYACRILWNSL